MAKSIDQSKVSIVSNIPTFDPPSYPVNIQVSYSIVDDTLPGWRKPGGLDYNLNATDQVQDILAGIEAAIKAKEGIA